MSAKDDYPPSALLYGSAKVYEGLWAELDELRSLIQSLADEGAVVHGFRIEDMPRVQAVLRRQWVVVSHQPVYVKKPEMTDEEALAFYEDPANREPQGPPRQRVKRPPENLDDDDGNPND